MRSSIYKHREFITDLLAYLVTIMLLVCAVLVIQHGMRHASELYHSGIRAELQNYLLVSMICFASVVAALFIWLVHKVGQANKRIHWLLQQEDRMRRDYCGND